MLMVYGCVADCAGEPLSVTLIVIGYEPAVVAVPTINPVPLFSAVPGGKVPALSDQV